MSCVSSSVSSAMWCSLSLLWSLLVLCSAEDLTCPISRRWANCKNGQLEEPFPQEGWGWCYWYSATHGLQNKHNLWLVLCQGDSQMLHCYILTLLGHHCGRWDVLIGETHQTSFCEARTIENLPCSPSKVSMEWVKILGDWGWDSWMQINERRGSGVWASLTSFLMGMRLVLKKNPDAKPANVMLPPPTLICTLSPIWVRPYSISFPLRPIFISQTSYLKLLFSLSSNCYNMYALQAWAQLEDVALNSWEFCRYFKDVFVEKFHCFVEKCLAKHG